VQHKPNEAEIPGLFLKGGDRQDVPHAARLQIFRHKFMGYVLSVTAFIIPHLLCNAPQK